jgi:hypothetical protein
MLEPLSYAIIAACFGYAAWSLYAVARNRIPREPHVIGAGVIEVLLIVQLIVAIAMMFVEGRPDDLATFIAYLVFVLLVIPLALFWALAEKSRWGTMVLVIATLVVPVLVLRLGQIWEGTGA